MEGGGRGWIRRLNVLFRFTRVNLGDLDNGKFQNLLDDLHLSLYDTKRDRQKTNYPFDNRIATREAVGEAQRGLRSLVDADESPDSRGEKVTLFLEKQELRLGRDETGYWYTFVSRHFPTNLYMLFAYLLDASAVKPSDFRYCSNDECKLPFVPLRKPPKDAPCYCSPRCANLFASRSYRKRQSAAKKKQERKGRPTKVKKTPRKPK